MDELVYFLLYLGKNYFSSRLKLTPYLFLLFADCLACRVFVGRPKTGT